MRAVWCRVYGLGAAFETHEEIEDMFRLSGMRTRRVVHVKVFLGPLLVTADFPLTKWRILPWTM